MDKRLEGVGARPKGRVAVGIEDEPEVLVFRGELVAERMKGGVVEAVEHGGKDTKNLTTACTAQTVGFAIRRKVTADALAGGADTLRVNFAKVAKVPWQYLKR
jgi:hypothetical protein